MSDGKNVNRGELLEKVFEQIVRDVYVDDFTAIAVLLKNVSNDELYAYLPEGGKNDSQR